MYSANNDNRYQQGFSGYVYESADLYRTTEKLVYQFKELEKKVKSSTEAFWKGTDSEDKLEAERNLNLLLDAQTNLDGAINLMKTLMVTPKDSEQTITVDMVRETFYNMIPIAIGEAVEENLIAKRDYFEDEDGTLYPSAAAITLVTIVKNSQGIPDGIQLINGKVVKERNCPKEYLPLMKTLMQFKDYINAMSAADLKLLKEYLLNSNKERPHLEKKLTDLLGAFYMLAIKVSQLPNFNAVAREALQTTKSMV